MKNSAGSAPSLEVHYRDMQDIEFTVERGKLYILQTRSGKRTARAAVKIATDMVEEGVIDQKTALKRVDPEQLDQLLHRRVDPDASLDVLVKGLPASPGAASGRSSLMRTPRNGKPRRGKEVILVRMETTPEDIHGMVSARGILTSRGGMTSHAAVAAPRHG